MILYMLGSPLDIRMHRVSLQLKSEYRSIFKESKLSEDLQQVHESFRISFSLVI